MPNEIKSFDGREALDEFLNAVLPRALLLMPNHAETIASRQTSKNLET